MRTAWGIDTPPQTPPKGRKYEELERRFLAKADELGRCPAELDIEIWQAGSRQVVPPVVQGRPLVTA